MNNRAKKAGGFKELISQLEVWEPWYIPGLLLLIFAGVGVTNLLPGLYGKMIDLIQSEDYRKMFLQQQKIQEQE